MLERAHAVDELSDASSAVISSDTVIKTLIFQKTDIVMMNVADVNLDYAIIGTFTFHLQFIDGFLQLCTCLLQKGVSI